MNGEQVKINQESNGSYCLEIGCDRRHFYDLDVLLETVKDYLVKGNRLVPEEHEPLVYTGQDSTSGYEMGISGQSGYAGMSGVSGMSGYMGSPGVSGFCGSWGYSGSTASIPCAHCGYTSSFTSYANSSVSRVENLHERERVIVRNNEEGR